MPSSGRSGAACCTAWPVPSWGSWRKAQGLADRGARRRGLGRAVAGHDHDMASADARRGIDHMRDQRAPAQTMQHFGQAAFHARALAGRHDDHVDRCLDVLLRGLIHAFVFRMRCFQARIIGARAVAAALGMQHGQAGLQQPARSRLLVARRLPGAQTPKCATSSQLLAWHRQEALPKIIALLQDAQTQHQAKSSPAQACEVADRIREPAGRDRPRRAGRHRARAELNDAQLQLEQVRQEQCELSQGLARPGAGAGSATTSSSTAARISMAA